MIEFLGGVAKLLVLLFSEFFSAQARARQDDKEFKLDQEQFEALVHSATLRMREQGTKDSSGAGKAWDQADQDR